MLISIIVVSSLSRPNIGHLCSYHIHPETHSFYSFSPFYCIRTPADITPTPDSPQTHTHTLNQVPWGWSQHNVIIIHRIVRGHCPFSLADVPFVLSNSSHSPPCPTPRLLRPICSPIPHRAPPYPPCLTPHFSKTNQLSWPVVSPGV